MRDPREFQFDLPITRRPATPKLEEKIHHRAWSASKNCTSLRPADPALSIRAIVIHATAGSSTEGAISVMEDGHASFHWIVPDENEKAHGRHVWATAPEKRACWHVQNNCRHEDIYAGTNRVNDWSLGVEIVNAQSGGDRFSHWQVETTAKIVSYAWAKYPNLVHVVSHARLDPARRSDPGENFPWETFRSLALETAR